MDVKQILKRLLATLGKTNPDDPPLKARRRLIIFGAGIGFFVLFQLLTQFPWLVESVFGRTISPVLVRSLSAVTGVVGFSVLEWLLIFYFALWWYSFWRLFMDVRHKKRSVKNALSDVGLRSLRDIGVIVTVFYVVWGFNYARPPLRERLQWPDWQSPETEELDRLATLSVGWANEAYHELHGTDDTGLPTGFPEDPAVIDAALEEGFKKAVDRFGLQPSMAWTYPRVKYPMTGHLMARFSTAGFFFPWTGETNVLGDMPAMSRPMSMAHEKAHQRGTGPELEATFLGFIAAIEAPHPLPRYSAAVYAMRSLVGTLYRVDPERAMELVGMRVNGISRDLEDLGRYWNQFSGPANAIGRAVNDRYLRMNRVHGGVASYSMAVQLLITFLEETDIEEVGGEQEPGS